MARKINYKKKYIIMLIIFLILIFLIFWLELLRYNNKSQWHFAIIPHFMLNSEKVDLFYSFIKNEYYNWSNPDKIILISPNHFYKETKKAQTICTSNKVNYRSETVNLSNINWISCDKKWEIFYQWWDNLETKEHWIWEHFQRINKYFNNSEIFPIVSPCFNISTIKDILPTIEKLKWNILVITSVDFAHYQHEQQTLQHDEKSIETLKNMTLNETEFINWIDADCPVCLYLLQSLANKQWQKPELWRRDSSSTIMNQDMWEENTSRIFMRYK